ncbi:hypothetical protein ACFL96_00455 [Thermoproteota archaeon]
MNLKVVARNAKEETIAGFSGTKYSKDEIHALSRRVVNDPNAASPESAITTAFSDVPGVESVPPASESHNPKRNW